MEIQLIIKVIALSSWFLYYCATTQQTSICKTVPEKVIGVDMQIPCCLIKNRRALEIFFGFEICRDGKNSSRQ